ncbi:hypothetical protein SAMN02745163_02509 [Clostridium cavendishii DSM 21758]|uniref:TnsE C-terminal domain-containing protein n=1 Tax=Clostridium cavendishii DSM 21758 TaxID=1121302 RepID=A0A1M6LVG4_9CLOT|nr:Tn7-like element transposition protein TnsE [Clostridium cavendishii]SHJ75132.1 hypothetical protein SAMN02745163_02509 [Clostridium cavendishii DSM 21758]
MKKKAAKITNWPFEKSEKAILMWLGEPFKRENKWMVNTYFKVDNRRERITLDWSNIHFLSIDKCYINGDLNNGMKLEEHEIIDIDLTGIKAEYIEKDWSIWGKGFNDKLKSKTFNFIKNGVLYNVPTIEIIRAILAPNRFLLNRIVEMNTLETYFGYKLNEGILDIQFYEEYNKALLTFERICHLAWILTNENISRMFYGIGQKLWYSGDLKFDFLFDNFNIKARVERREKYIRILEIVGLNNKRINVNKIEVHHPSLEETELTDEAKKRVYIHKNDQNEIGLNPNIQGATKSFDALNTQLISHNYELIPKIEKVKTGRKIRRSKQDEDTKIHLTNNEKIRTTADEGGEEVVRGLEFTNMQFIKNESVLELNEIIEVLKLLEKRGNIKKVEIMLGELPISKNFSWLSDGITRRRYIIGKIIMIDGRECFLLDVEREKRSLSMILLVSDKVVDWNKILWRMLFGLVNENGKWSRIKLGGIERLGVKVIRKKHIRKDIYNKEISIYKEL